MNKYIKYVEYSVIAAVVMAMIEMMYEGIWGIGFWAAPTLISGVVLPSVSSLTPPIGFLFVPLMVGMMIHMMMAFVFALILAEGFSILSVTSLSSRVILGAVYGFGIFIVSWFIALGVVDSALLALSPIVFALSHMMFGAVLGYFISPETAMSRSAHITQTV